MNSNNLIIRLLAKYPYLGFSTIILVLLSIYEWNESRQSIFADGGINWWFILIGANVILYAVIKNFSGFQKQEEQVWAPLVRKAIITARLHRVEKDEDGIEIPDVPSFRVTEYENTVEIEIDGFPEKLEKDYEKAISVFENVIDLDIAEWKYTRGRVSIVLSKTELGADYFYKSTSPEDYLTLGIDSIKGEVHWQFNKFPHMLLVGGTGSGKSTMFKSVIAQMPREWELFFCDPKQVEFAELLFQGYRVAFDNEDIKHSIDTVVEEMENRYALMRENRVKEYRELNGAINPCFLIIDEFAAFFSLLEKKDADLYTKKLRTLVQKGRAAGVQLILMTQKPSSKVLDTDTRDNLMCQVAMGSNKTEAYVMAFGDEGRECSPLSIGEGYYNIGQGIRKMKTYNLSTDEFVQSISEEVSEPA